MKTKKMFFKYKYTGDDWPKNTESWAEFMLRKDCESKAQPAVAIILATFILLGILICILFEEMDKFVS
jgi:hypothetical protein